MAPRLSSVRGWSTALVPSRYLYRHASNEGGVAAPVCALLLAVLAATGHVLTNRRWAVLLHPAAAVDRSEIEATLREASAWADALRVELLR